MLLIILMLSQISVKLNTLQEIRDMYAKAIYDSKTNNQLIQSLEIKNELSNTEKCYLACAYMVKAKFLLMPWDKLNSFNKGKTLMEETIKAEPDNVENIFLRYAIQKSSPAFLNYNQHLNKDKAFLEEQLPLIKDAALKQLITDFLKQP
jgi:hypothetical protein